MLLLLALGPTPGLAQTASDWLADDLETFAALSESVDQRIRQPLAPDDYAPNRARFAREWWMGTYAAAAWGHAQVGLRHPELAEVARERTDYAIEQLLRPEVWAFDAAAWGCEPLAGLRPDHHDAHPGHDHAALGYLGVAMGLERLLDPDNRHADAHDALIAALSARTADRPLLATYPGEAYPVDNAAAVAAIGLHARATGQPRPPWLDERALALRDRYTDERGLLIQWVEPETGAPLSPGRGSGTAYAAYLLGFTEPRIARSLARSVRTHLATDMMGFAAVREYPPGVEGEGDVDSGELIMGLSVSATGFSLAAARRLEDAAWFGGLWTTASTFGGAREDGFSAAGPLHNALMLAMLTAPPLGEPAGPDVAPVRQEMPGSDAPSERASPAEEAPPETFRARLRRWWQARVWWGEPGEISAM